MVSRFSLLATLHPASRRYTRRLRARAPNAAYRLVPPSGVPVRQRIALDLNLFPVLSALLCERSVKGAARRLGRSQPAVSEALRRLRTHLNDPLLVRMGRAYVLSPRAIALIEPVEETMRALDVVLSLKGYVMRDQNGASPTQRGP